jgi:hypothetical protein
MKNFLVGVLIVLGVGGAGLGGAKFYRASQALGAQAAAAREQTNLREQIAGLRAQREALAKRAAAIEADNALLSAQLEKTRAARAAAAVKPAPVSWEAAERRILAARQLGESGDPQESLRELLWCWDEGIKQLDSPRRVSRRLMVATALATLAQRHPPALAAMHDRWTSARARFLKIGNVDDALMQFSTLSDRLGEKGAMLALYDELPADDARRSSVRIFAHQALVDAQRYQDALVGRSLADMLQRFELQSNVSSQPHTRAFALQTAARDLEVLAGAGELVDARELIQRILKADSTPATRDLLRRHLQRAGVADLVVD